MVGDFRDGGRDFKVEEEAGEEEFQYDEYQYEDYHLDDYQYEDYGMDNVGADGPGPEIFQYPPPFAPEDDGLQQQDHPDLLDPQLIDPQLANLDPNNAPLLHHHHHHHHHYHHQHSDFNALDPHLQNLFPNGILEQAESPYPGVASLSNQMLLSFVRMWQNLIYERNIENAMEQPVFLELMGELVERGVVSREWRWKVDVGNVDLEFVRVAA